MILKNISDTKTCDPRYGSTVCGGAKGEYALADVSVFGLLSNSSDSQKKDKTLNLANYSMNDDAFKAGQQYINVATLAMLQDTQIQLRFRRVLPMWLFITP